MTQMATEPTRPATPVRKRQPYSEPVPSSANWRRHRAIDRFVLTYLRREIRGRLQQALLMALGLGLGVGLVITVSAASAGVSDAQNTVLRSLYGIGTDLTVTKTAATNNRVGGEGGGVQQNMLQTNSLGFFPSAWASSVARLAHVSSSAAGLELSELTQSGGIPQAVSIEGVDVTRPELGPLAAGSFAAGHNFLATAKSSNVAVIDADYAATMKLSVGSTVTVAGTTFRIIGLVRQTGAGGATDIYVPLGPAQTLGRSPAGKRLTGQANVIYVAATTSSETAAAQSKISGSLGIAADLTNDLGRWVAAAALLAAFAVASLLTTAAVNRRIRELGTLKALGWSTKRIIAQIMSESAVIGLIGAVIGIAIGFAGAAIVGEIAPRLSTIIPQQGEAGRTTTAVRLAAHVSPASVITAVLLAIAGALIAGAVGARRATNLQPADAFAEIG
jgi:putative ABC transport system permease protein